MRRPALASLILVVLLAACGGGGAPEPTRARGCDDGGSGGVMIDGVCL